MDKIEIQTKTVEQRYHRFYCDHCGTHLGTSRECDDGYYKSFGDFALDIHTPAGRYYIEKCLCNQCIEKYLSELYTALDQLGFKKKA